MQKRTREILALVLLVLLGVIVAGAMGWYILVGHNWNKAASHIDDLVGSMEGYTVVVYEGARPQPPAARDTFTATNPPAGLPADIDGIAASYREKGAAVVKLQADDPARYEEPIIVLKNGKRMGIMAVQGAFKIGESRAAVRYLQGHGADFIIGIYDAPFRGAAILGGVDLAVFNCNCHVIESGEWAGSTFCVDSPYIGSAKAVIIAPSGVMTAKTIVLPPEKPAREARK